MIQTERHIINENHQFYKEIDELSFTSKNLYNAANYLIRQNFFNNRNLSGVTNIEVVKNDFANHTPSEVYDLIINEHQCINRKYVKFNLLDKMMIKTNNPDYRKLPAKVSKQILMLVDKNWKSFFESIKDFNKNPKKYKGMPSIPKYKNKTKGRFNLVYELGAISQTEKGFIKLSCTNIKIKVKNNEKIKCVNISKNNISYTINVVYEIKDVELKEKKNRVVAVDLGINNLLTITNTIGERPVIINGKPLKSINQFYNKKLAELKAKLPTNVKSSKKIKKFTDKRNNKMNC